MSDIADIVQWGAPKVFESTDFFFYDYMSFLHYRDKWLKKYTKLPLPGKKNISYIRDIPSVQLEDEGLTNFTQRQFIRHYEVVKHLDGFITMSDTLADHIRSVYGINIPHAKFRNHANWFETPLEKRDEFVYIGAIPSKLPKFLDALDELESYAKKRCFFVKYDPGRFASGRFKDNGKCMPMSEYDFGSKYGLLLNVDNFNQSHELIVRKLPLYLMCGIYPVIHSSFIESINYCRSVGISPIVYDHIDEIPCIIDGFELSKINRRYFSFEERVTELMESLNNVASSIDKPVFSADWFTCNIPNWNKWLKTIKDRKDLNFLEIGCFEGRATLWILTNFPNARVTAIDTFDGGLEHKERHLDMTHTEKRFISNVSRHSNRVTLIKGDSRIRLRELPISSFDVAYIDGSHIASDVISDAILSWELIKDGGLIIFDDYEWRPDRDPILTPKVAIDSFLHMFSGKYKLISKGYQVCIQKCVGEHGVLTTKDIINIDESSVSETRDEQLPAKPSLEPD